MVLYEDKVGRISEAAIKTFLERCGYKVIPYGVEHTLCDVVAFGKKQYSQLQLIDVIRTAPDFFVLSPKCEYYRLLEIKYCNFWSETERAYLKADLAVCRNIPFMRLVSHAAISSEVKGSTLHIAHIVFESLEFCL